jgi:2-polyprenyl-3-methyl-5-hydroxy-6-metoxy-1,4-benzoquinol methylase
MPPSTSGYASEVDALFERYESRDAAAVHAPWYDFFPKPPARILDIGAGTGRDAGWLASLGHDVLAVEPVDELRTRAAKLHPEPEITWLADILPALVNTRARGETFDMVLMHAVWMHLTEAERIEGMANVASLMHPGARLLMSQRHGPVPAGRRMFDVSGEETIVLAAEHSLINLFHERAESIQAENRAQKIEWTKLVFEKT